MLKVRPALERGYADHGWLKSFHSFSFAAYVDPAHMGWGNLRVINEDWIAPERGFGTHGHRDMEIITYLLSGQLAHQDSMGHVQTISVGEVQHMSAGTGVRHSEFNPLPDQTTHLLQIWITPRTQGIRPAYHQQSLDAARQAGQLGLLASGFGEAGVLPIHADARVYAGLFSQGQQASLHLDPLRKAYVQVAQGGIEVNGVALAAGDAALLSHESQLNLHVGQSAEVLVFDLAA